MGRTRTGTTEVYAHSLGANCDLTFDLATLFLFATHCLVMMIICAKLFLNPTMHNKVMGRTRTGPTVVYAQVQVQAVTLTFDLATFFLFATYCLVMIISCANFFSNLTMPNKVMGRARTHRLVMIIICAKLFSNPTMHTKVMDRARTGFTEVYAQSLSADCDLDL